ncbi:MAG: M48 family metalloprotease [Deltaproteobacteria bacterium]|jgi:predicted Zn-dependent protease|nr:M48 family metalloprotease [Deltaproteobacteria bacterium]
MITRWNKLFRILIGLLLLAVATACSTRSKPEISLVADSLLASEAEQLLWQKSELEQRTFESNDLIYADPQLESYLNHVVARLMPETVPADLVVRVNVIKSPYLNAFAYPNGMIYIHSGLLARMDNEAQLAAVLAHEMVHCIHRHALQAFRKYKNQPAYLIAVQQILLKTKGLQKLARSMGVAGAMTAISGYARELEAEADRIGFEWVLKAGYNPKEALSLFDQMLSDHAQDGREEPFFFGSHPQIRQRADNLQNLSVPAMIDISATNKNSQAFFAKLDQLLLDNARLDIRLGRFHVARESVEKFLSIKPGDTRAFFLLGEIYRQRGQHSDVQTALDYYSRAIHLDPSFAAPHKAIGLIHYKKGRHALAKKFFESCLQLSPDSLDKAYIKGYLKQCTLSEES